jgi:hypothetical protein
MDEQRKLMPEQTDLFIVLSPNYESGHRVHSIEMSPERAIEALRLAGEGKVVKLPQVEIWASHSDDTKEAEPLPDTSEADMAKEAGDLGEFVARNDL